MRRIASHRATALLVLLATIAAVVILAARPSGSRSPSGTTPVMPKPVLSADAVRVRVAGSSHARPIPPGFIGFSVEYTSLPAYAGNDPSAVNPVLEQLIRNLTPGQSPVIRIGGDSTDRSWYRVPGVTPPGGIRYTITQSWIKVTQSLAHDLDAKLIFGINLEANNTRLASGEARALVSGVGQSQTRALEIGNEPELYGSFPWYQSPPGHGVRGRPSGYDLADYTGEFKALAPELPQVPLAGPATGGPEFMLGLPSFVQQAPRLGLITLHRYGLRGCFVSPSSPQYHTISNLLATTASKSLADSIASYTHLGLPVRVDEINSVNCGGVSGVSDTFASALWALNTLFELARVGVKGVNFHTFAGAHYAPFVFTQSQGHWQATVEPMYYGLMLFAQAAPPGSRLLDKSVTRGGAVHVWPLRTPTGQLRVVLVNESRTRPRTVSIQAAGHAKPATVQRLRAPSVTSKTSVKLGGQSFGTHTATGTLPGSAHTENVNATKQGDYRIRLPAASAALLTVNR